MPPDAERIKAAVLYVIEAGFQLTPEALEVLRGLPDDLDPLLVIRKAVELAKEADHLFLDRNDVEAALKGLIEPAVLTQEAEKAQEALEFGKGQKKTLAKEVEADIEILMDPTSEMGSSGQLGDFLGYFRDRFKRLYGLLEQRMGVRGALCVSRALRASPGSEVKMIGMVREKREVEGKIIVILEDKGGQATVVFTPRAGREAYELARRLMPDQVVCVRAVRMAKDLFLAKELVGPDVPMRNRPKEERPGEPIYAVLISDIHYGSVGFMEDVFRRFLAWLNGELGNQRLRELAGAVKYVVVAGDIVDGIGVYPGQEAELSVPDIHRQYEDVAALLSELPDHVELVLSPGNHDACRRALPQPAVPEEYAGPLYELDGAHMLGNPCLIALHGIRILVYHGNSFDDMVSVVPGLSFDDPLEMMKLMLWARHLAPIYGMKTPLAPTARDLLVIEEVPDVFHTGHIHVTACGTYRGILLVNSGAWQEETAYQRARGVKPTPGRAVLLDLSSLRVAELDFTRPELWA